MTDTIHTKTKPLTFISDNPQDKLQEIVDKLQEGIKEIFNSTSYKEYLKTLSKFHNYSFNNCLLIALQKPDATLVGGFKFWCEDMNRPVKKGEKAINIIAPAPQKRKKVTDILDENGKPKFDANGQKLQKTEMLTVPAFKVVNVFDVSQTDGEPIPELGKTQLTGDVDQYKDFFAALEKTSPVPIRFDKTKSKANGYYDQNEKCIVIKKGMSELQNLKTLIHEIAHARIHDKHLDKPKQDRNTQEVEAESIAYTVCQHFGLDTSEYSFPYIASWYSDKELNTLKATLDSIRYEANDIISESKKHYTEIQNERQQHSENPYRVEGIQNMVKSLDEMHTKLEKIEPDSPNAKSTYESTKKEFKVAEALVPGGYTVLKDMLNHVAQSENFEQMKDRISEMKGEFEKRLPVQYVMEGYNRTENKPSKTAEPQKPYISDKLQAYKRQIEREYPQKSKQQNKTTGLEK